MQASTKSYFQFQLLGAQRFTSEQSESLTQTHHALGTQGLLDGPHPGLLEGDFQIDIAL